MPKIVDHDARRAEYVDALWRLVSREGAGAISVRSLAAEAGVSPSNVVHYLPSRAAMLAAAVREHLGEARRRADALLAGSDTLDLELATDLVMVAIPDSPKRRRQSEVWLLLMAEQETNPEARALLAEMQSDVRTAVRDGVDLLADNGLIGSGRDRALEAAKIHALIDGLSVQAMVDQRSMPPVHLRNVVRNHLATLADTAVLA